MVSTAHRAGAANSLKSTGTGFASLVDQGKEAQWPEAVRWPPLSDSEGASATISAAHR